MQQQTLCASNETVMSVTRGLQRMPQGLKAIRIKRIAKTATEKQKGLRLVYFSYGRFCR